MSNLSHFNMIFFFKAYPDISDISQKWFKEIIYNNKSAILMELR